MAKTGKNHLRRWEYPASSGIVVAEIINRFSGRDGGLSYRVTIPKRLAGERQFKQFTDLELAENWAKKQHEGILKDGQKHFLLSPELREDAIAALSILEGTGLSLSQAVSIAKKYHGPASGHSPMVEEVVAEMLAQKETENLRPRSIKDLKNRLAIFFSDLWTEAD